MTDPKVKEVLKDLCKVIRDLTDVVEKLNRRVYALEDKSLEIILKTPEEQIGEQDLDDGC